MADVEGERRKEKEKVRGDGKRRNFRKNLSAGKARLVRVGTRSEKILRGHSSHVYRHEVLVIHLQQNSTRPADHFTTNPQPTYTTFVSRRETKRKLRCRCEAARLVSGFLKVAKQTES